MTRGLCSSFCANVRRSAAGSTAAAAGSPMLADASVNCEIGRIRLGMKTTPTTMQTMVNEVIRMSDAGAQIVVVSGMTPVVFSRK
jgi:hypothetical protein